ALMLSMYVLGKAVSRSSNSYNLVAMSAFFLLLYNPYFLLDVGFQLSYLAVLGLIYFYPKIYHMLYIKNWFGNQVWSYIALSCAAQLATFPLGMYYFHQFPVYFLISNLFIVLPVIVIMYVGIAFLFIPWDVILKPLGSFLELGIIWMDKGLFFIEQLPFATYSSYHNFTYYVIIYLIIGGIMLALQFKSKRFLYGSLGLVLILFSYQSVSAIESYKKKSITFYSLRKNIAFSFFDGDRTLVYSDIDSSDKALAFSVHAAVQAQSDKVQYISLKKNIINRLVYHKDNFLKFRNFNMLIWNKEMTGNHYQKQVSVDVVLISGNPNMKINEIVKAAKFKVILIDGTNPDYKIKRWQNEATELSINSYVLKKNPAYTINLE
ncbi:MAG: ComEC/Rec2 family competence protein, partial [Sphingobacteriaceae bacterium]